MADPKQIALRIFHETLANLDIPLAMERRVDCSGSRISVDDWSCDLRNFAEIKVVALGKAAHAMLTGFAQLFPDVRFTGVHLPFRFPVFLISLAAIRSRTNKVCLQQGQLSICFVLAREILSSFFFSRAVAPPSWSYLLIRASRSITFAR